jgi:hypothetical protein
VSPSGPPALFLATCELLVRWEEACNRAKRAGSGKNEDGLRACVEQGYEPTIRHIHRLCHSEYNDRLGACRSLQRPNHTVAPDSAAWSPTNAGVGEASSNLRPVMFAAALAEAEALNAEGNEAECLLAARRAKQMLEPG